MLVQWAMLLKEFHMIRQQHIIHLEHDTMLFGYCFDFQLTQMDSINVVETSGMGYIMNILEESLRPGTKTSKFVQGLYVLSMAEEHMLTHSALKKVIKVRIMWHIRVEGSH